MNRETLISFSWLVFLVLTGGCARESTEGAAKIRREYIGPETTESVLAPEEIARRKCQERMREVLAEPAVPGVPELEEHRAEFLARAKAEPVFFKERPEYAAEPESLTVKGYRELLTEGNPYGIVSQILRQSAQFPKQARDALLHDGYLYTEDPALAYAMETLIRPHQLFGFDRIWIERGERVLHATRRAGRYYYADGPLEGERVRLLIFDRAGGGETPPPPLHLDFRAFRYREHFDRMQIRHVTNDHIVANLHYGKWWVPSVLATNGAHVELECESLVSNLRPRIEAYRRQSERREHAVQGLRRAMLSELEESLPFDEPLHEYGFQLDGELRKRWLAAYLHNRSSYAFNGDRYDVFDSKGRPLTPEVCVDFLTDTIERMTGTWYRPRGEKPERLVGKFDFDALAEDRAKMRRVPGFVTFAKEHPDWFDVEDDTSHIELGDRDAFFGYLASHVDDFAPGDAILIKGKTPWDPVHAHFHSFFVYESDPVTGMPLVIVGNAGRPSLRSWETEVRRTPERSILYRIRPATAWLESVMSVSPLDSVPPLAAGPD